MVKDLKALAENAGYKLEFIPIHRLNSLQRDLEQMRNESYLHKEQKERLEVNIRTIEKIPKKYTSVIIAAVPRRGHTLGEAQTFIVNAVKEAGFAITARQSLPLKRLAVQSGLTKYGRNNITYINSMGSWLSLAAFLTTIPCEEDTWIEQPVMSTTCENCDLCINSCPTGAIHKDRFLLYRENCKNHCPACQDCCPMNENGVCV